MGDIDLTAAEGHGVDADHGPHTPGPVAFGTPDFHLFITAALDAITLNTRGSHRGRMR